MEDNHVQMVLDKISTLETKEDQRHDEQMEAIASVHRKQDKTNGRLGRLEKRQSFLSGGLAVITILVLPILFMILTRIINEITF